MEKMFEQVYAIVARIPCGRVCTYGHIARLLGNPRLSRAVGYALHGAPESLPCHRGVNRFGGLSDAFLPAGRATHRMLLELEGVTFDGEGRVEMDKFMWYGD
jgi:methylated-DNA-protein-cysteine methyltransferase-like protein